MPLGRAVVKRAKNLWPQLVSFDHLHACARRALRGKRKSPEACAFHADLEVNVLALQRELEGGSYEPGAYRTFRIVEPKPRLISVAPFRDRVVHHAVVAVIEPAFERRFIHHSYACRAGKGTHAALAQFRRWAAATGVMLKLDIRKYFPTIDHEILKALLRKGVGDARVLALCDRIIDASNPQEPAVQHFPGDDLLTPLSRRRGLPIGNLTSQFFANVYLDPLDHFVTDAQRCGRYLRYMDDFVCFDPDKGRLRALRAAISTYLPSLRLKLNEGKSRIRRLSEGVEFLGFVHRPGSARLAAANVRRQRRRVRALRRGYAAGALDADDVRASLTAWCAHAAHGDADGLVRDVTRRAVFQRRLSAHRPQRSRT